MPAQPNPQLTQMLHQQLKDVHLPEAISWWPMAMAWWVLLILVFGLLCAGGWYLFRKHRRNKYRKSALHELNVSFEQWQTDSNNAAYLQRSNALLKRVLLHLETQSPQGSDTGSSAGLSGVSWAIRLNSVVKRPLSDSAINALVDQSYKADPQADIEAVQVELRQWLINHRHSKSQSRTQAAKAKHA